MNRIFKRTVVALAALALNSVAFAQQPFKSLPAASGPVHFDPTTFRLNPKVAAWVAHGKDRTGGFRFDAGALNPGKLGSQRGVVLRVDKATGQVIQADGRPGDLEAAPAGKEDALRYFAAVGPDLGLIDPTEEIKLGRETTDKLGQVHQRIGQQYRGVPVEPADAYLHASDPAAGFDQFFGRLQPTPEGINTTPALSAGEVLSAARKSFGDRWYELSDRQLEYVGEEQMSAGVVIYYLDGTPRLSYRLELHPNLATHVTRYVDAHTGTPIHEVSHICGMAGMNAALPPETADVRGLDGERVRINTFRQDGSYFLFDVSRPMFNTDGDGNATGVIHSFDATGQSPLSDEFDPTVGTSGDNRDWSRTAVSVHHNGGLAYEYYRNSHARNSIDGLGGTVYSFYNVGNEDGSEMDNAFFSGRAMYYGNGDRGFKDLPMGVDIAGHEMTHGVIRATANLVYELQPGAINESMADVFGYLIEGESGDFRLAEDVVNPGVFTSGALRDMRDPNNGGSRLGDRGWQPAHMDEFVVLANDEENDHGGVHVNSGIPNRAFYLFASNDAIGDRSAEEVYYHALDNYLTRNSRFIDLRIAIAQSARELLGDGAERIANEAFAAVGIGENETTTPDDGGDYEDDIDVNPGDRFILHSDPDRDDLFLADESGNPLNNGNAVANVSLLSRPSITDDGSIALFVDDANRVRALNLRTGELVFIQEEPNTIWRNISISKDGRRMALTTTEEDNIIFIANLERSEDGVRPMALTNPTTAEGIDTDNVLYPDVLEWEPGGEFLMYDALNELDNGITFWDINLLRAWDLDGDRFGDGNILKLYDQLEPGTSIGNPSFAKNSPYIIAFDRQNQSDSEYAASIMAANIERGETNLLWDSDKFGVPDYSIGDERIIFDSYDQESNDVLARMELADNKIESADEGRAFVLIDAASWGKNFANGQRTLPTGVEGPVVEDTDVLVYPTATTGNVTVERSKLRRGGNIQVFDMNGRELLRHTFAGLRTQVGLATLPVGGYLLAIPVEAGVVIRKVVRQ